MGPLLRNPRGAVYGTITVGALLAAETARGETYVKTVGAVMMTLVLYWLADSYAALAAERLRSAARLTVVGLLVTMRHELPILTGAALPLVTVLVCWVAGASLSTALTAAVWTAAAIIVAVELVAGLRARLSGRQLVSQTLIGAVMGLLIVALRALLH